MTEVVETRTSTQPVSVTAGSVFAWMWALANVDHLLNQTGGDLALVSWVNFVAAMWVFARPSSAHRVAALAATQLLDTVWLLPYAPDHQMLAAAVNVCILVAYVSLGRPGTVSVLIDRAAPGARVLMLIAYAAAATAKYNSDFLDRATSCASFMARQSSFGLIDRNGFLGGSYVVATLAAETLVPILLIVPRTRRWGVMFAGTFHFLVSLSPTVSVTDFTMTLWALFVLFLPIGDVEAIGRHVVAEWRRTSLVARAAKIPRWALGVLAVLVVVGGSRSAWLVVLGLLWPFVTVFGLWILITTARLLRSMPAEVRSFGRPNAFQLVVAVLMVGLVATPYLGLGTSSRFTMFSGLRTEGPGTNHLFMPSVHLVDSQNDAFIVLDSTGQAPLLAHAASQHLAMPVVELRRILQHSQVGATLETFDGRRIVVRPHDDNPLREPPGWWEAKTQHYRAYEAEGLSKQGTCQN
jgi:hypothetical protein